MIHFSTIFNCTSLDLLLSILETSNLLLPPSHSSKTSPLLFHHALKTFTTMQAHVPETEGIVTVASNLSKVHSPKAAIFHTMAYKLSLEINKNKITPKTLIAFHKVLYNISQIKRKKITFEQYSRFHVAGPKIAICETASNVVFVSNSSFTSKLCLISIIHQYFHSTLITLQVHLFLTSSSFSDDASRCSC